MPRRSEKSSAISVLRPISPNEARDQSLTLDKAETTHSDGHESVSSALCSHLNPHVDAAFRDPKHLGVGNERTAGASSDDGCPLVLDPELIGVGRFSSSQHGGSLGDHLEWPLM